LKAFFIEISASFCNHTDEFNNVSGSVRTGEKRVSDAFFIRLGNDMTSEKRRRPHPLDPNPDDLLKLAEARMPFGKYAGYLLVDLPEAYVVWFSRKGFPKGKLGEMLRTVYEIKVNGLEYLFKPL
jgi:uncharacterized protein (DUF3820 family)